MFPYLLVYPNVVISDDINNRWYISSGPAVKAPDSALQRAGITRKSLENTHVLNN